MFPPPNNQPDQPPRDPNTPQRPNFPQFPRWAWFAIGFVLLLLVLLRLPDTMEALSGNQLVDVPYSFFREQVNADNVSQVIMQGDQIRGLLRNRAEYPADGSPELQQGVEQREIDGFTTTLPPVTDSTLIEDLIARGVVVDPRPTEINPILLFLFNWGPLILLLGFFIWSTRRAQRQMTGVFGFGRTQAREYNAEKPQVTFVDVAGQDAAKTELVEIVDFLKEPDKYIALGARIPRGVLLVGPPGTGKTLLARAVAGEANVAFFSITASEFVEMFVGVGASRVRDLFAKAKAAAPAIVFIDEIDAVGRQRGAGLGGGNDEREQTLNQMLAEMDGFDRTESIIVMAATNRPDVLDPALLRPGRFDRQITVALPDRKGRLDILKVHVRGKPIGADVNLEQMAKATIGFSGADLANLTNEAALNAARKSRKQINSNDFLDALDRILLGTQSPPLSNEQERRVVAYHEAGHALVSALTPGADPVLKVTIVPRGQALGVTASLPEDDRRNYSREYLKAQMNVLLGGRAAEEVAIGEITTGASSDLQRVTSLARRMVASFGMSDAIGPLNFGEDERQPFLGYSLSQGRSYSEATAARIDAEVRHLVEKAHEETLTLMRDNRDKLDLLAQELLNNEVVDGTRVAEIAGVPTREVQVALQQQQGT
ncbi:MAG: ATP-dependent zinc metalloprotease FtsH [Chloroflexota bacterium]|nr:ATP-dependent zinc metalloprotease FtsH [Chloroflexota bacterium]